MTNGDVIDRLVADLAPIDAGMPVRRIALGLAGGAALAAAIMWLWIGPRPDLAAALGTSAFWIKFAYTLGLALAAGWALQRLARPAGTAKRATMVGVGVLLALSGIAIAQYLSAAAPARPSMLLGSSSDVCPWRIAALSLPIFAGAVWAVRGLAPTRLPLAGAALGLAAGAAGALVYSFACGETAAPFVVVWYSLGIAIVGALGALSGRWLLRW